MNGYNQRRIWDKEGHNNQSKNMLFSHREPTTGERAETGSKQASWEHSTEGLDFPSVYQVSRFGDAISFPVRRQPA